VHKSVKYKIWASTTRGNHTLNRAYHEQNVKGGPLYLFFSVNGSGVRGFHTEPWSPSLNASPLRWVTRAMVFAAAA
jgi:hypothetical protein